MISAAAGLSIALFAAGARAEAAPAWLNWSAPPECPTAGDIERRAVELFGGPIPKDRPLAVATDLRWNGARWEIALEITLDEHRGEREVTLASCAEAADFVAVAVVLALDPTSSERLSVERRTDDRAAAPSASAAEPVAKTATKPKEIESAGDVSAATESGPQITPHVSVTFEGAVGILPSISGGGAVWAGADIDRLSASLVAEWSPTTARTFERAAAPIDFGLVGGRVNVAYWFLGPALRVGPSLSVHAGAIESGEVASERSSTWQPWLTLGLGPQAVVQLVGPLSLLAEAELNVPLAMPTFVLDDGTAVHDPGIGGKIGLGARFSFGQ